MVEFREAAFACDREALRSRFMAYAFTNGRAVTKSTLAWWAFYDEAQELFPLDTAFDIEHIYARKRAEVEDALHDHSSLEALGNKSLLEKRINIHASDYRFSHMKKYYKSFVSTRRFRKETKIRGLIGLADELSISPRTRSRPAPR